MKLKLKRTYLGDNYTIGKLYIDGKYFCDTLEDTYRGLDSSMPINEIMKLKKKHFTAIPKGIYKITMNIKSPRFSLKKVYKGIQGKLPRLKNVPGFTGVLIHIGNYPKDTSGCILVGENNIKGAVLNSKKTFFKLYDILKKSNNQISIEII